MDAATSTTSVPLVLVTFPSPNASGGSGVYTYAWTWIERPTGAVATFSDPTAEQPTVTGDVGGPWLASCAVDDGAGQVVGFTHQIRYGPEFPDVIWTVTGSTADYGTRDVTVTLSADGTPTAPDSWALYDPQGVDQTSRITGSGHTVSAQLNTVGGWRFEASSVAPTILAVSVQNVLQRSLTPLVGEPAAELFGA